MDEHKPQPLQVANEAMTQYTAVGNELRFYADQRFKIAGAFLLANGLLANVAKDYKSIVLGVVSFALCYLCLSWEMKTTLWWGFLIEALKRIESAGVEQSKLTRAYLTYQDMPDLRGYVRPSTAARLIYVLFAGAWLLYTWYSWPHWWERAALLTVGS